MQVGEHAKCNGGNVADLTLDDILLPGTEPEVAARYASLAQRAAEASFGLDEEEVVVLDTETTGINYQNDEIIQIAAAIMKGPQVVARFNTFVNPEMPIPPETVKLTGITDADVADAPSEAEALRRIGDILRG